ncbi:hypothetical protein CEUSTIGMA_g2382.t1 [Chlamydomonas eustigma]|uniref:GCK domain-containing protein n=1 Tax=Chlamydomonas eustigma TaxID=1157962 RepID=A0A250WVZ5_9CHLO|nr:hypothetical protein CEUSTIGMA_g2382.t1 [Chlamydomonas eustigma]|eukprot:GAX74936.1 hypothetical protein CEUSTIGMA_g2382.t1 [Chlamydomonas eustigma]
MLPHTYLYLSLSGDAMGSQSSKPDPNLQKAIDISKRKCSSFTSGLEGCRKANGGAGTETAAKACKNLEIMLVTCWAEDHCKDEADEHRRCYTKLYKTGIYKGLGHCMPYEDAMKTCLKKKGISPL